LSLLLPMPSLKKSTLFLLYFLLFLANASQASQLDSLLSKLNTTTIDSQRVNYLLDLSTLYFKIGGHNDETFQYAEEAVTLSKKTNNYFGQAQGYLDEAKTYEISGNNQKALDCFLQSVDISEKRNLEILRAYGYHALSDFYVGSMRNTKKALEYSLKELDVARQYESKHNEANALTGIGIIYYNTNDFRQSLHYFIAGLHIMDSLKEYDNAATVINNIGSAYTELKVYDSAVAYYQKSLSVYNEIHDRDGEATALANIGNIFNMKGDAEQGVSYLQQALVFARQIADKDLISGIYGFLAEGYSKQGDYEKAFEYQADLSNLKDTLFNEASSKQVNDMQVKYDTEKKEKENKILELSVNRQKIITYSISIGLVLVIVLVFFVYRGYVTKKKAHEELAEKNKIIEEKNKDILDSINYAKTIQNAILTPDEYLKEELGEYFIVYKPRDVVSGDFYWCSANGSKVIFTVADCTGHGVPGAFMSMIGNSILNEVVIENKITDAAQILNTLRANLLKTLQQKGQNAIKRDGMDIALCVWDKTDNTLQFAGANNPLYLLRNNVNGSINPSEKIKIHEGNLVEFLPDKQPIGYFEGKTDNPFTSHTIQLNKGDIVYISTDGFADQFGGEKGKKYTKKKFRETLISLSTIELNKQQNTLDKIFETWKGNLDQTDDICLMGIKIS